MTLSPQPAPHTPPHTSASSTPHYPRTRAASALSLERLEQHPRPHGLTAVVSELEHDGQRAHDGLRKAESLFDGIDDAKVERRRHFAAPALWPPPAGTKVSSVLAFLWYCNKR
jgi:hypothetical protein